MQVIVIHVKQLPLTCITPKQNLHKSIRFRETEVLFLTSACFMKRITYLSPHPSNYNTKSVLLSREFYFLLIIRWFSLCPLCRYYFWCFYRFPKRVNWTNFNIFVIQFTSSCKNNANICSRHICCLDAFVSPFISWTFYLRTLGIQGQTRNILWVSTDAYTTSKSFYYVNDPIDSTIH